MQSSTVRLHGSLPARNACGADQNLLSPAVLQIQGKYQHKPAFPWVSGAEFSGVVSAKSPIPKGCPFVPGQTRVFGAGQGSYAEKIKVDWRTVLEVPERIGLEAAAGLYVTMPTSYAALVTRARTQPGEWVMVHAAAGGGTWRIASMYSYPDLTLEVLQSDSPPSRSPRRSARRSSPPRAPPPNSMSRSGLVPTMRSITTRRDGRRRSRKLPADTAPTSCTTRSG